MPQTVLKSPMGQMLMPMLNQQIHANKRGGGILGIQQNAAGSTSKPKSQLHHHAGKVHNVTSQKELQSLLEKYRNSCAVVFFTSATCPPCKGFYPLYDQLADEVGDKGVLIKVDVSAAFDVGSAYSVSATPTFITFLKGKQESRWSGADRGALQGNVRLLVQMAWPAHAHQSLNLPTFSNPGTKPVLYTKVPPLEKLLAKMGSDAENPAVQGVKHFIEARSKDGPAEATLPDMAAFTTFVRHSIKNIPTETLFAVVDLIRIGLVDPRFSGYLAEEVVHGTVTALFEHVNDLKECPYALRLVTLQMACNLFSSQLYADEVLSNEKLRAPLTQLVSSSLLDDAHNNVRVAAASLLFNITLANSRKRRDGPGDVLPQDDQIELAASILEAIAQEGASGEALEGMLLALGYLAYRMPLDGELSDLLRTMDAGNSILDKKKAFPELKLIDEVGSELLGKGLNRP